jgi:hypothetical protein
MLKEEDKGTVSTQLFSDTVMKCLPQQNWAMGTNRQNMDLNETCLFFCEDMDFLFESHDKVCIKGRSAQVSSYHDSARQQVARLRRSIMFASKISRALAVANQVKVALESLDPQGFDDLFSTLSWIFDKLKEEDMGTVSCTKFYSTVKRSLVELIQPWASVMQPDTTLAPEICCGIVAFVLPPRSVPDENMGLDAMCLFFCKNLEFLFLPDGKDSKRSNDHSAEMAKLRKSPRFANKIPRALALASQVKMTMQNHLTSEPEP